MKNFISLILLTFIFSAGYAQKNTETIKIQTTIYCDHCIECPDCGVNIFKAVKSNSGVKNVDVLPEENAISVTYKTGKTTPDEIRQSIADIGFDADDVKASPDAYAKLDACCKAQ